MILIARGEPAPQNKLLTEIQLEIDTLKSHSVQLILQPSSVPSKFKLNTLEKIWAT